MAATYDYEAQEWRDGTEGDALLLTQTIEELDLLAGSRDSFARLLGLRPDHIDSYIDTLQAQRTRLEAAS